MEFPAGLIRLERVLTTGLLALVASLAVLEARSPLAKASRENRPWVCRVRLGQGYEGVFGPASGWAITYTPRGASLIWLGRAADSDFAEGAPEFNFEVPASAPQEPPLALEKAVMPRTLTGWVRALRPLSFERALLLIKLAQLSPDKVRPAYLPEDSTDQAAFTAIALGSAEPPPRKAPITVEVLNASGQRGIAYDVTKFLRSRGADVVHYGNIAGPAAVSETIVFDRTGRFEDAEWVRDRLGCPAAAVSQVSAKSLVDVTVVLADDCKL